MAVSPLPHKTSLCCWFLFFFVSSFHTQPQRKILRPHLAHHPAAAAQRDLWPATTLFPFLPIFGAAHVEFTRFTMTNFLLAPLTRLTQNVTTRNPHPASCSPTQAMISYAWADKDLVRPLVTKLERMNLEIKFANDIHKPIIPVRLASTEEVAFSAAAFVTAGQLYIDLTKGVGANSHEAIAASIFKLSTTSLEAITISSTDVVVSDNNDSIVGEGSFGVVRKGLYLESIPVAVKTLKLSKLSEKSKLELINEANILQKSRHPFIIGFHGVININNYLSLVLEFASLGSLHDYYLNPDNEDTPLKQRLTFLIQVSAGMSYLHDTLKIMHNDLKSLNVLLTKTYQDGSIVSKITDFGLSKIKTETMTRSTLSAAAGSILWLAPELKSVRPKVSTANDVYSFAVLMTEVLSWAGAYGIPWEDSEINLQGFIDALRFPNDRDNLLQELQSGVFQPYYLPSPRSIPTDLSNRGLKHKE
ncbi:kinase-like domain-containing protein [Zopfochytrium polystomum]|nr:kinase-like domain-containing protein [Zopfochytrium polystomum]